MNWQPANSFIVFLSESIHYCSHLSYEDYLNIEAESKCILEIVQQGSSGNTLRVYEAIELDKILITNNVNLINNEYYDNYFMFVYSKLKDIDVKSIISIYDFVSYKNKECIHPIF